VGEERRERTDEKKPKPAKTKNPFKKQKLFWGNGKADLRGMWGEQRPD
jgi:hypothetical protein